MKKLLGIILATGLTVGVSQVNAVDSVALAAAGANIASQSLQIIPKLILDIPAFPARIKAQADALRAGYAAAALIPVGPARDAKIQELSVNATNILVEINNILDNFLRMAKLIGPVVKAFNVNAGNKTIEAIDLIANTMYLISKIAVAEQKVVERKSGITPENPPVPVEMPDL